jgi:hypothetical protein
MPQQPSQAPLDPGGKAEIALECASDGMLACGLDESLRSNHSRPTGDFSQTPGPLLITLEGLP